MASLKYCLGCTLCSSFAAHNTCHYRHGCVVGKSWWVERCHVGDDGSFSVFFSSLFGSNTEVTSRKWEFINMSEEEEDLIYRMHKLVGNRWDLIAGRIPGRKPEDIERFWLMRHNEVFRDLRKQSKS